jgi:hypothetical protein
VKRLLALVIAAGFAAGMIGCTGAVTTSPKPAATHKPSVTPTHPSAAPTHPSAAPTKKDTTLPPVPTQKDTKKDTHKETKKS